MAAGRPLPGAKTISQPLVLCALTLPLLGGVCSAGQAAWTRVDSWNGKFWLEHTRDLDEQNMFGFNTSGWVRNSAEGSFTFDHKTDSETWTGSGNAIWKVDEFQKVCDDNSSIPCRESTSKGQGAVPIGEDSELWIDVMSGTYELTINPGGEYLDGMEVDFVEVTLGTTEPEHQRAPVHTHAYADAFYGYFEEDVDLPRDGLTLCGSQTRSDGTVFRWKLWPSDRAEPQCLEIEGG